MTMGAHIVGQKCGTSVPMAELRGFVDRLRDHYGVPYPLAHHQPFISGRQLVYEAQDRRRDPGSPPSSAWWPR